MTPCKNLSAILNELNTDAQAVSEDEVQQVVKEIMQANRVFVAGAGRSGFAARAFSNRLLHLGRQHHQLSRGIFSSSVPAPVRLLLWWRQEKKQQHREPV